MLDVTHLSFTRLKELAHSPLALHRYIERGKIATKAMNAGSLLDCMLFTPEQLNEVFYVIPNDAKKPTKSQINAAKPSAETLRQIEAWEQIEQEMAGRITVTADEMQQAEALAFAVRNNSTVKHFDLLNPEKFEFQVPIEFIYKDYLHRGVIDAIQCDAVNNEIILWDLKRMGNRSGRQQVAYQIRDNKYDLQAAIYTHYARQNGLKVKYLLIAVNDDGYVTPFEITADAIEAATKEWDYLIASLWKLSKLDYVPGCEFWAESDGLFRY